MCVCVCACVRARARAFGGWVGFVQIFIYLIIFRFCFLCINNQIFWTGRFRREYAESTPVRKRATSPKFCSREPKDMPALVMTDLTTEAPNFVVKRCIPNPYYLDI